MKERTQYVWCETARRYVAENLVDQAPSKDEAPKKTTKKPAKKTTKKTKSVKG